MIASSWYHLEKAVGWYQCVCVLQMDYGLVLHHHWIYCADELICSTFWTFFFVLSVFELALGKMAG